MPTIPHIWVKPPRPDHGPGIGLGGVNAGKEITIRVNL
jgi:hypothetical protein